MKLQSRPMGINRVFGKRHQPEATEPDVADIPLTNMQSLAAELQQSAQQGSFQYPANWSLVAKTAATLLVMLSVAHAARTLIPMIMDGGRTPAALLNWTTLGLLLGIAGAGLVAGFLVNLFPNIQVSPEGLAVSELTGWHVIPWSQIGVLRVMEVSNRSRYVVLVPFNGKTKPATPAPMMGLLPVLAGGLGWGGRGLLLTSDMKNCDKLLQLIVSYVVQASGQNPNMVALEAYVDEDVVMPVAQLLFDPEAEIARVASAPNSNTELYGVSAEVSDPPIPWTRVMTRQVMIAAVPVLLLLSDVLMRNNERTFVWQHALWAVILLGLGLAELPFVATLVRAVGELMVGSGQFNRSIWAYLELQMPRAALLLAGSALVGVGAPAFVAQGLWFAGILLTTFLTVRYVQRLYYMPLSHTLLAALGTFIFQFSLLALYFGVR